MAGRLMLEVAMKTLLLCIAGFTLACATARADKIKIVAAENFYGGVAAQIAGPYADVTSILSNPNQDPHEFTTNASTAKEVADADIVIYSGAGYDSWMEKLLSTTGKPGRTVICVANLIGAKDGDNPHIWYDPRTMPALADKLVPELTPHMPQKRDFFQRTATGFKMSMKRLQNEIDLIRKKHLGTTVTATEPVFGYMAHALGFKMLNYDFQVNVMNDTEPSAAQTATFEKSLKIRSVRVLFYNSQVADPTTDRIKKIAGQYHVPIVGVTETQPEQKSYVEWMLGQLNDVEKALKIEFL
jgi:zinc/manganese transport system substrate-binding protein